MVIFEGRNQLITVLLLTSYLTLGPELSLISPMKQDGYLFIYSNTYWVPVIFQRLSRHWTDQDTRHSEWGKEAVDGLLQFERKVQWLVQKAVVLGVVPSLDREWPRSNSQKPGLEAGAGAGQVGAGSPRHYLFLVKGFLRFGGCPMFPPISPCFVLFFWSHVE